GASVLRATISPAGAPDDTQPRDNTKLLIQILLMSPLSLPKGHRTVQGERARFVRCVRGTAKDRATQPLPPAPSPHRRGGADRLAPPLRFGEGAGGGVWSHRPEEGHLAGESCEPLFCHLPLRPKSAHLNTDFPDPAESANVLRALDTR